MRREFAGYLQLVQGISERRVCQATGFGHSSQRYRKRSEPHVALRMRLTELAAARVRYGRWTRDSHEEPSSPRH